MALDVFRTQSSPVLMQPVEQKGCLFFLNLHEFFSLFQNFSPTCLCLVLEAPVIIFFFSSFIYLVNFFEGNLNQAVWVFVSSFYFEQTSEQILWRDAQTHSNLIKWVKAICVVLRLGNNLLDTYDYGVFLPLIAGLL